MTNANAAVEGRCNSPRDSSGEPLNLPKKCYDPNKRVSVIGDQENVDPSCDSGRARDNVRRSLGWGPVRKSLR